MAKENKGRRRKLPTIRETAASELERRGKPSWLKRFLKAAFLPVGAFFKWLAQPVELHHSQAVPGGWTEAWTKQRSMVPAYVRNSFFEIRLVVWPPFSTAMRLTTAVIIFAIFFALLVALLDWVLTQIFEEIILNKAENLRNLF